MLREEKAAGTSLGKEADKLTSRGQLVPDATINQLVECWLASRDSQFVFDGYPRSLVQGQALDEMLAKRGTPLDVVLSFEADLSALQSRVKNRVVCACCGRNFSVGLHVENSYASCPACGGSLVRRADDTDETLAIRMLEYAEKTAPLGEFYKKRGLLRSVNSMRPPEEVFASVVEILEEA